MHAWRAARIRYVRPAAVLLFETAASHFGGRLASVVLSGTEDDGTTGVRAVRKAGGFVIAQDEQTGEYPDMSLAAAEIGRADLVLPLFRSASP